MRNETAGRAMRPAIKIFLMNFKGVTLLAAIFLPHCLNKTRR
jgi:hypothetical protein